MTQPYKIATLSSSDLLNGLKEPYYYILLFEVTADFSIDFNLYTSSGKTMVFLSPYQVFKWISPGQVRVSAVIFHGDFYCIEYHKKEVACNGLLFNNIYQHPHITVSDAIFREVSDIIERMASYNKEQDAFDIAILRSYLQLVLALSSKEKQQQLAQKTVDHNDHKTITDFQNTLETHYLQSKDVSFYAAMYGLSVNAFSKKIKLYTGKTPSLLIRDRIVLEAKKLLHLTNKPVKEIASDLNFEDEFYFSRYFKKEIGVSPRQFRETVGISIVAK